jgi:hypothetical protein
MPIVHKGGKAPAVGVLFSALHAPTRKTVQCPSYSAVSVSTPGCKFADYGATVHHCTYATAAAARQACMLGKEMDCLKQAAGLDGGRCETVAALTFELNAIVSSWAS